MRPVPAKVTKTGLRFASNLATNEFVLVPVRDGKAAPGVPVRLDEVVVPAT